MGGWVSTWRVLEKRAYCGRPPAQERESGPGLCGDPRQRATRGSRGSPGRNPLRYQECNERAPRRAVLKRTRLPPA